MSSNSSASTCKGLPNLLSAATIDLTTSTEPSSLADAQYNGALQPAAASEELYIRENSEHADVLQSPTTVWQGADGLVWKDGEFVFKQFEEANLFNLELYNLSQIQHQNVVKPITWQTEENIIVYPYVGTRLRDTPMLPEALQSQLAYVLMFNFGIITLYQIHRCQNEAYDSTSKLPLSNGFRLIQIVLTSGIFPSVRILAFE